MIGVVDETGLLEPDEIFVQIRRDSFKEIIDPNAFPGVEPMLSE